MSLTRPTLKAMKMLPEDKFVDATMCRLVKKLPGADRETKRRILAQLSFTYLEHPLLQDADSFFTRGALPELHKATKLEGKPVYEVRDRTKGPAWRGAVVLHQESPWLVYADKHDRFHATAAKFFKDSKEKALPSAIDLKILQQDRERQEQTKLDQSVLIVFIELLEEAIRSPGRSCERQFLYLEEEISVSIELSPLTERELSVDQMHENLCDVEVSLEIGASNPKIRARAISLWIPFLQEDPSLREAVYGSSGPDALNFVIFIDLARVTQLISDSRQEGKITDYTPLPPRYRHYTARAPLTEAYVEGKAVQGLCGVLFVPTRDGQEPALPICSECEKRQPVAQTLIDLICEES